MDWDHYGYIVYQIHELALESKTDSEKESFIRALRDQLEAIDSLLAKVGSAPPRQPTPCVSAFLLGQPPFGGLV